MGAQMAAAALQNPHVQSHLQQQAYSATQQGFQAAKDGAMQVGGELHKYVQEGPAGISILCFLGGLATCIIGCFGLVGNFSNGLSQPFQYVLNAYLTFFGFVAILLEADVEILSTKPVIGKLAPVVEQKQFQIFEHAKFLTELRGRGLFYIFVGSLAGTQCLYCLLFLCGLWNAAMGIMCLLMSFGINPADHLPVGQQPPPHYGP